MYIYRCLSLHNLYREFFFLEHNDENLRHIFVNNRQLIYADHHEGKLKSTFNFPTNNLHRGYREIRSQLMEIYNSMQTAYRINLAFGLILHNSQTGEYRYYVPHYNSKILQFPFRISNMNGVRFLMNKLTGIDILTQARSVRPSTNWTLAFITNVQYVVYKSNFPLGAADQLPDHIRPNRNIRTMFIDSKTGEPYSDNLCFFRCLKSHLNNSTNVLDYYKKWINFCNSQKPGKITKNFKGVSIQDMPELEKCFNLNILIYSLSPSGVVSNLYKSLNDYSNKMYLNLHENHLSYIVNFSKLSKKYQCEKCLKLFDREWNMQRHYKNCYKRTKYNFPGGFHKSSVTIFDKLDSLGIHTPAKLRYYKHFVVWDMEAMLQKINQRTSDKLQWISRHVPVSVSITSNVQGFESPRCFVETSTSTLILKMMTYIKRISFDAYSKLKKDYSDILNQLEELHEKYDEEMQTDSESENRQDENSDTDSDAPPKTSRKMLTHFIRQGYYYYQEGKHISFHSNS